MLCVGVLSSKGLRSTPRGQIGDQYRGHDQRRTHKHPDGQNVPYQEVSENTDNIEDQSDDAEPVENFDDSEEADDIYVGFIEDAPQTGLIDDIQSVEFYDDIPEEAVEGMDIMPEDLAEKPVPVKTHKKRRHKKRR